MELVFESRVGDLGDTACHRPNIDNSRSFGEEGEEGVGEAKGAIVVDIVGDSGLDSERFGGCIFEGKADTEMGVEWLERMVRGCFEKCKRGKGGRRKEMSTQHC